MQVASKLFPPLSRPLSRRARSRSGWLVWGFAAGLYFVAVFHRMVLGVAALEAERRYHVGAGALSAFTAVQLGVYLAMQVPVGLAADRHLHARGRPRAGPPMNPNSAPAPTW